MRGILTNPVYAGEVYAGRTQAGSRRPRPREDWIAVASVPAIVTRALFDRVQAKLARNRRFSRRNNTAHPYLLRALVGCGVCGLACFGRSMPPHHRYYCCAGKLAAVHSHREAACPARYIPAAQLEALVWDDLCGLLAHPEAIRRALERAHGGHWLPQELRARREALRRGQAGVRRQVERMTEAYLAGVVGLEEYRRRRGELERREQALEAQERQLGAQVDRQAEIARLGLGLEEFCRRVREGLERATWDQRRQLLESLVARVIVTDGEVEIRYMVPVGAGADADRPCRLRSDYRGRRVQMEARRRRRAALANGRTAEDRGRHRGRRAEPHARPRTPGVRPHRMTRNTRRAQCVHTVDPCNKVPAGGRFRRSAL